MTKREALEKAHEWDVAGLVAHAQGQLACACVSRVETARYLAIAMAPNVAQEKTFPNRPSERAVD